MVVGGRRGERRGRAGDMGRAGCGAAAARCFGNRGSRDRLHGDGTYAQLSLAPMPLIVILVAVAAIYNVQPQHMEGALG